MRTLHKVVVELGHKDGDTRVIDRAAEASRDDGGAVMLVDKTGARELRAVLSVVDFVKAALMMVVSLRLSIVDPADLLARQSLPLKQIRRAYIDDDITLGEFSRVSSANEVCTVRLSSFTSYSAAFWAPASFHSTIDRRRWTASASSA